jgi:hypothetical protein
MKPTNLEHRLDAMESDELGRLQGESLRSMPLIRKGFFLEVARGFRGRPEVSFVTGLSMSWQYR